MTEKKDGLSMSLDDYIQESNFYFSPYGDIGLINHPKKVNEETSSNKHAPFEENRDILDLNRTGEMADELSNIMKELDDAGNQATKQKDITLSEMIVQGKVKGLPKGTHPEIGLEHQGIALPLKNMAAKPGRSNLRNNPFHRPAPRKGDLANSLKFALEAGKIKSANNFQRLPNTIGHGFYNPPQHNGYYHNAQQQPQLIRPPAPQMITMDFLNGINLDVSAYRNLMQKNVNGGLSEYMSTVSANLGTKYDLKIQREIAEKQKKCVLVQEDGGFLPISSDGPGIESECLVLGTNISLNSRFSAI